MISETLLLLAEHEQRRLRTLNLVASENLMSPAAKIALSSDLAHRYNLPPKNKRPAAIWDYPNQEWSRKIETRARSLAQKLFSGSYSDVRPLSGNNIANIVISGLLESGDTVMTVPASAGGHFATAALCQHFRINRLDIPYDSMPGEIDITELKVLLESYSPKLIYLDASMIQFPYPVRKIRELSPTGTTIIYDASHCFGLIAGGRFQKPLLEGANMLVGSTHKSMFGPQKGLIVGQKDDEFCRAAYDKITPLFVSNSHVHHIAALAITLEELTEYGAVYSRNVILNAKALGRFLSQLGVETLFADKGFTECHQLLCKVETDNIEQIVAKLEHCGIHVNGISLPFNRGVGIRLGTAELTRRGFGESEMRDIAHSIADVLQGGASVSQILKRVRELSTSFKDIYYGFDEQGRCLGLPKSSSC